MPQDADTRNRSSDDNAPHDSRRVAWAVALYSLAIAFVGGWWLLMAYAFATMVPPDLAGWARTRRIIAHLLPDPMQGGFVAVLIFTLTAGLVSSGGYVMLALGLCRSSKRVHRVVWSIAGGTTCLAMAALLACREW